MLKMLTTFPRNLVLGLHSRTELILALVISFAVVMTAALAPIHSALAADTPQAQQDKVRAIVQSRRPPALSPMTAGCERGDVLAVGYITGTGSPLLIGVFCRASLELIFAEAHNELRQETLTLALAAMGTGRQVFILVEGGRITAFAAASGAAE